MTTLGDTLTPTVLTSENSGVSIKVEQGVLCENNDEFEGRRFNAVKRDISPAKCESNHPNTMENDSNRMDTKYAVLHVTEGILQPGCVIKAEPDVDIDDRQPDEETEENVNFHSQSPAENLNATPKIRLTPTSKLIAAPNGLTDKKRRYACPYENCTKSYGKSSHLRSHLTWHTGIKPFVCKEPGCGRGFTRSDELSRHTRTHTGEKPFECVHCTKKFARSDHLTKHLATHTKQLAANKIKMKLHKSTLKAISTIMPVAEVLNASLTEAKSNSPQLITERVTVTEADSSNIKLEKPEKHDNYLLMMSEQDLAVLKCQTLPERQLTSSLSNESNIAVKVEPLDESHASTSTETSYPSEPDDDTVMPEANLPPLSSVLNQTTSRMVDTVYNSTRPFPCCRCTKSFKRQDDLNRHMRTHTGEKPFACNECDKRFMRSDHLKKHMNTHTRVR